MVKVTSDLDVDKKMVQQVLKQHIGLTYRRMKKVPIQANSTRCMVQRQQSAKTLIENLQEGK